MACWARNQQPAAAPQHHSNSEFNNILHVFINSRSKNILDLYVFTINADNKLVSLSKMMDTRALTERATKLIR